MNPLLKRLMFLALSLSPSIPSCAQGLEPGNLLSVHVVTVTLRPNVPSVEFRKAFVLDVLPEYEKNWLGIKGFLLTPFFAHSKNQLGLVWFFKSVAARNLNFEATV